MKRQEDVLSDVRSVSLIEAATSIGISKRTLYRLISAGEFPRPFKVGRSTRVLVADIRRYIDRQRRKGGHDGVSLQA